MSGDDIALDWFLSGGTVAGGTISTRSNISHKSSSVPSSWRGQSSSTIKQGNMDGVRKRRHEIHIDSDARSIDESMDSGDGVDDIAENHEFLDGYSTSIFSRCLLLPPLELNDNEHNGSAMTSLVTSSLEKYSDDILGVSFRLDKIFLNEHGRFSWHKTWVIPTLRLTLNDTLWRIYPTYDFSLGVFCVTRRAQPLGDDTSYPTTIDSESLRDMINIGLYGETHVKFSDRVAITTALRFISTSAKLGGKFLHLLYVIYISKNNESFPICSWISQGIWVDSRAGASGGKPKLDLTCIQPFHPELFDQSFIKKVRTGRDNSGESTSEVIDNSWEGLFSYLTAPNIRNKCRHPVFLSVFFSSTLALSQNTLEYPMIPQDRGTFAALLSSIQSIATAQDTNDDDVLNNDKLNKKKTPLRVNVSGSGGEMKSGGQPSQSVPSFCLVLRRRHHFDNLQKLKKIIDSLIFLRCSTFSFIENETLLPPSHRFIEDIHRVKRLYFEVAVVPSTTDDDDALNMYGNSIHKDGRKRSSDSVPAPNGPSLKQGRYNEQDDGMEESSPGIIQRSSSWTHSIDGKPSSPSGQNSQLDPIKPNRLALQLDLNLGMQQNDSASSTPFARSFFPGTLTPGWESRFRLAHVITPSMHGAGGSGEWSFLDDVNMDAAQQLWNTGKLLTPMSGSNGLSNVNTPFGVSSSVPTLPVDWSSSVVKNTTTGDPPISTSTTKDGSGGGDNNSNSLTIPVVRPSVPLIAITRENKLNVAFDAVFLYLPIAMMITTVDSTIYDINYEFCSVFRCQRVDLIDKKCSNITHADDKVAFEATLTTISTSTIPTQIAVIVKCKINQNRRRHSLPLTPNVNTNGGSGGESVANDSDGIYAPFDVVISYIPNSHFTCCFSMHMGKQEDWKMVPETR